MTDRQFWETPRPVTHAEAREAARRLVNSHFRNPDGARVSIPANPGRDDDLVLLSYIAQREREGDPAAAGAMRELRAAAAPLAYQAVVSRTSGPDWRGPWRRSRDEAERDGRRSPVSIREQLYCNIAHRPLADVTVATETDAERYEGGRYSPGEVS